MAIITGILTVILFVLGILLVVIVTMQTPKTDGLGSGVSNTPASTFRGKAGYDEMLSVYTRNIAIAWFSTAFILYVLNP
jgi:protein translocase SecG subunit